MDYQIGLIGYPLGHSFSPEIHKAALVSCGLQGNYSLFPIPPGDFGGLKDLLMCVRDGEITGLNVTIPHKQTVIPLLDVLTPTARIISSVNTIYMRENKLIGDNTDVQGFLTDLQFFFPTKVQRQGDTKSALVLGAGGSARAVVYALASDGWEVMIAARRLEQAQSIVDQFLNPDSQISRIENNFTTLNSLLPNLSLIVNTTPVGMSPNIDASPWPANLPFPSNVAVYDLVYNPSQTKLVKDAHAVGLSATTGMGMLIEQAALSFEIWTGYTPQRSVLWNAVEH